ncbi:MAG TPA: hypothetical protein VK103_00450, partial [Bacillota bacterium]|nr:hypothetical protein [Bacillota bacterium]
SGVDADVTGRFADEHTEAMITGLPDDVRGVRVRTVEGRFAVLANLGDEPATIRLGTPGQSLVDDAVSDRVELAPLRGTVLAID